MGEADRIARGLRRELGSERKQRIRSADRQTKANHARLVAEARALIPQALTLFQQNAMSEMTPFRVTRKPGRRMFAKDRAGWCIGWIRGFVGHGETGEIPVYLVTTGEFLYGGEPFMPGSVDAVADPFFRDDKEPSLRTLIALLRKVVRRFDPSLG